MIAAWWWLPRKTRLKREDSRHERRGAETAAAAAKTGGNESHNRADPGAPLFDHCTSAQCTVDATNAQQGKSKADRTTAASVDSAILEAQLGGPDPDSVHGLAVAQDWHIRHANMRPAHEA